MKYLYLDCDDVLLDTTQTFMDFMRINYGIADDINKYPSDWDISTSPFTDFKDAVKAFAQSDYYKNIPPMSQAQAGLQALQALGYKFFVVSSCPNDRISQIHRRNCLINHFGNVFEDIVCLSFSFDNKGQYFSSVPKGLVIDDSIHNVNAALKHGHDAILMAIAQNGEFQKQAEAQNIAIYNSLLDVAKYLQDRK